jgi:hypothetical protein
MPFLTGLQSDLIREAFDNLHAASSGLDELRYFRFSADDRSESQRAQSARNLRVNGLVEFMGRDESKGGHVFYMPTEQGIDEALRLGVISIADVTALSAARKRAELRANPGGST